MLVGRKLYKDNAWNTICLPFNVTIANSPLAGATVMKLTPSTSKLTNGTLTLNFEDENTTMTAGTPYIIKWASGDDIENPVFTGVTIDKSAEAQARRIVSFTGGQFVGTYSPVALPLNDQSNLFLGANNTLCWPNASNADPADDSYYINACRAYFHIGNNTAVREFRLNFGDNEAAGITTTNFMNLTNSSGAWYSLDGRKLNSKPTARGVYIHGGCKVVIK
jgi:hypothetical protein